MLEESGQIEKYSTYLQAISIIMLAHNGEAKI